MRSPLGRVLAAIGIAMLSTLALADPAARVGRISAVEGQVSFRSNGQAGAQVANLNWPVTSMNQLTTGRNGRAELRVGSSVVQLNGDTELEVTALDDEAFQLRLNYGSIYINVRNAEVVRDFKLGTPHGSLRLTQPSRVRVDTEVQPDMTSVAVSSGAAQFDAALANLKIGAGKRVEINDSSTRSIAARTDAFDDWSAARERLLPVDGRAESVRYVSPETTGQEELDRYGEWRVVDDYGPVWTPRNVSADWAPYRDGRWIWMDPWGWTWVDNAPWGYAPSHYGRWVWLDLRWYWVPGRMVTRPVWAPAVVGWVGGSNWSVTVAGRPAPAVGWFPLAPHEVYVPAYRVSPAYVERINHSYGTAMPPNPQYRNARVAVTVMPQAHFSNVGSVPAPTTLQGPAPHEFYRRPLPSVSALAPPPPAPVQPRNLPPAPVMLQTPAPNPQAMPPRAHPLLPAMQQPGPVPLQTPQLQLQPQPQPQPLQPARLLQSDHGPVQSNPPPMQGSASGSGLREPHEHHRNEAQQQAIQQQQAVQRQQEMQRQHEFQRQQEMQRQHQPQTQIQQPAQQGGSRDHERAERAAARKEQRQSGEREGANH